MQKNNTPSSSNRSPQEATKEMPVVIQKEKDPQKDSTPSGKEPASISVEEIPPGLHSGNREVDSHADPLEPGEIPLSDPGDLKDAFQPEPSRGTNEEPLLLKTDPGEDTDDGDSSSSLHTIPFKNSRGRKSTKKKREEASYLAVLEGSQKTLKGMLNTRSKKGPSAAPKGANPSPNSN